jgi:MFS transporter, BCD family, chlorophyll transporter
MSSQKTTGFGWFGIVRLGAVQAAIGAMVMLSTSLLNRVMVVEYAVAAAIPAGFVGWHYAVQLSRPLWGHKSDRATHRSIWIIYGLGLLALGNLLAVDATALMAGGGALPLVLAFMGFTLIGIGVGMAGTAMLALLASRTDPTRKPAAAAICWTMMVAGIVIAAGVSGSYLDPFSEARLVVVAASVCLAAFCIALLALRGLEHSTPPVAVTKPQSEARPFGEVLASIWAEPQARRFTFFVFLSMLAYSMQDLILEPFAGLMFGMTAGQSTQLTSMQHSGVLAGMLAAGLGGSLYAKRFGRNPKLWIVIGCFGSAAMLAGLSAGAAVGVGWPLKANVFGLGFANGLFAVSAVGAMLDLASEGQASGEGARMGVWGAAQAIAFGLGAFLGAIIVDAMRSSIGQDAAAFQTVFAIEAGLFILAALLATGTRLVREPSQREAVQI